VQLRDRARPAGSRAESLLRWAVLRPAVRPIAAATEHRLGPIISLATTSQERSVMGVIGVLVALILLVILLRLIA
jgi:hypothetical protein